MSLYRPLIKLETVKPYKLYSHLSSSEGFFVLLELAVRRDYLRLAFGFLNFSDSDPDDVTV